MENRAVFSLFYQSGDEHSILAVQFFLTFFEVKSITAVSSINEVNISDLDSDVVLIGISNLSMIDSGTTQLLAFCKEIETVPENIELIVGENVTVSQLVKSYLVNKFNLPFLTISWIIDYVSDSEYTFPFSEIVNIAIDKTQLISKMEQFYLKRELLDLSPHYFSAYVVAGNLLKEILDREIEEDMKKVSQTVMCILPNGIYSAWIIMSCRNEKYMFRKLKSIQSSDIICFCDYNFIDQKWNIDIFPDKKTPHISNIKLPNVDFNRVFQKISDSPVIKRKRGPRTMTF